MKPCIWCYGTGVYADPMTNWDAVRCDKCHGTGRVPTTRKPEPRPIRIEEPAKKMRAQLAALKGQAS